MKYLCALILCLALIGKAGDLPVVKAWQEKQVAGHLCNVGVMNDDARRMTYCEARLDVR